MTAHAQMCEFCVSRVDGQTFLIAMTSSANVVEKEDMVEAFQDCHPRAADARPAPKPGHGVCWQAVARCGNKGAVAWAYVCALQSPSYRAALTRLVDAAAPPV